MNSKRVRSGAIYVLLLVALGAFLYTSLARRTDSTATQVPIARIAQMVREGSIGSISINEDRITAVNRSNAELMQSRKESGVGLVETLLDLGVQPSDLTNVDVSVEMPALWES